MPIITSEASSLETISTSKMAQALDREQSHWSQRVRFFTFLFVGLGRTKNTQCHVHVFITQKILEHIGGSCVMRDEITKLTRIR